MFKKITIKSRVLNAINAKIAKAEEDHKIKVAEIDAEAESRKEAYALELVNNILTGK